MIGIIYKASSSRTKIRDLVENLIKQNNPDPVLYLCESFFKVVWFSLYSKIKFVHIFNPTIFEIVVLKIVNAFKKKRKFIFTFELQKDYQKVAGLINKDIVTIETSEALEFFRNQSKNSIEVVFIRQYFESSVYVASGAKQLSIKKEILFVYDSSKNSKAHLVVEMLKYLPNEVFLTCVDDNPDISYRTDLKDIADNLKVDWRIKFYGAQDYNFDENIKDLFLVLSFDKEVKRTDFYYHALSQGLLAMTNLTLDEDIKGWFKLDSTAPKVLAKQIADLCEDYVEVDSKKALDLISKDAKTRELYDFYVKL